MAVDKTNNDSGYDALPGQNNSAAASSLGISESSGGSLSNNIIREEATSSVEGSAGENSSVAAAIEDFSHPENNGGKDDAESNRSLDNEFSGGLIANDSSATARGSVDSFLTTDAEKNVRYDDSTVRTTNNEGRPVSNSAESATSQPGVLFVPGPGFRGGIHTGYHSAQESDDDIENQTTLIEANPVPDEDEAAEIIDALQEQIESARQELQVAQSQVAQSQVAAMAVMVETNDNQLIKHDDDAKKKRVTMWLVLILGIIAVVVGLAVSFTTNGAAGGEVEGNEDLNQPSTVMESYSLIHVASKVGEEKNELLGTSNAISVGGKFLVSGSPGYSSSGLVGGSDEIGKGEIFNLISLMEAPSSKNKTNSTEASNSNATLSSTTSIITNSTSGDRCGAAVSATAFGRHYAIGCPSSTGLGYVKVFEWDFTSSPPKQVGITLYGKEIDDGFGVNIALSALKSPPGREDLRLAIGSNSGYAQLWDNVDGLWHPHDFDFLNHPEGKEGGEVTVSLPGSLASAQKLFVGYPSFDSDRGIVRSFVVSGRAGNKNVSLTEQFDGDSFLQGSRQGDQFGTDIDTDIKGDFVAIGAGGGGYVRAISLYPNTSSEEVKVRPVGSDIRLDSNDGEEESRIGSGSDFGSSVATGRVPYRGCPRCGFVLNGRRVAVGSSAGFRVFQFVEDESRWYQIAEQTSDSGMVEVSMSPDSVHLGVGTPSAEDGRGVLDVYTILDQEGDIRKEESMAAAGGPADWPN
eukprot:scaffold110_cov89-Skeletonema_dohrnii-CCMP3373.AAC.2